MSARLLRLLAPLAVVQMAAPAPANTSVIMVASCGGIGGGAVPIRIPTKDDGSKNLPCCKVCHIAMRKRAGGDSCCGNGDDGPDGE